MKGFDECSCESKNVERTFNPSSGEFFGFALKNKLINQSGKKST